MSVLSGELTSAEAQAPRRRRFLWRPTALFTGLFVAYFALGAVLIMRYNVFEGDGISRTANAGFTLTSRDPHLSAIGFVWNPLPSIVQIPMLPFARWWPELQTYGLAGVIQSAAFMAAAALMVRRIALDRDTGAGWRWVAVGCFALNPVTIMYGALAMSEAAEIFCVLWCIRYLLLWVTTRSVGHLAWAGMALGVGYLVRYEMAPAAIGAAALVAVLAYTRAPRETRVPATVLDLLILLFPIATAFVAWAAVGWVINGELFATLTSQYGNSSQLAFAREHGGINRDADWLVIAQRLFAMQPFVGIAAIFAMVHSTLTRRADTLVPAVICGAILAFAAWGQFSATTFGWFRFYIVAIPLVIGVALACWRPRDTPARTWRLDTASSRIGAAFLCLSTVVGIPVTARATLNESITDRNQVMAGIASVIDPDRYDPDEWYRRMGRDDVLMADYLDRKNLPAGAVLADTFVIKMLWVVSDNPKQFVITSDYDFTAALNRPWDHGVEYIIVTNPATNGAPDAVNRRYPTIWADGAGIGRLVHVASGPFGEERWRLYQISEPDPPEPGTAPR